MKISGAGIRMRALRRFGPIRGHFAGRSRGAGAGSVFRGAAGSASIDNSIDPPAHIVGNVKRTVGSHREAARTMFGFVGRFHRPREAVRKYFTTAGSLVAVEPLKNDVVA